MEKMSVNTGSTKTNKTEEEMYFGQNNKKTIRFIFLENSKSSVIMLSNEVN